MTSRQAPRILSRVDHRDSIGRIDTAERIYLSALSGSGSSHIRISGEPGAGTSEILRHTYDRLFLEQRFVVPFYFALSVNEGSARDAANRLVYEFILQSIAFRRNEPELIAASPDICELENLAPLADAEWVKTLASACSSDSPLNDPNGAFRPALASPIRAAAKGRFRVCVILDDLHNLPAIESGNIFLEQLGRITPNTGSTVFLSARRRFEIPGVPFQTIAIDRPARDTSAAIAERIALDMQVDLSASVGDLIVVRAEGRPGLIRSIIAAARDLGINLDSYRNAARAYSAQLARRPFDIGSSEALIAALNSAGEGSFPLSALKERLTLGDEEFSLLIDQLNSGEIIEVAGSSARVSASAAFRDQLAYRYSTDVAGRSTDAAMAEAAMRFLQNAPQAMAREYRREAAAGLLELLSAFDLQTVPRAAIDYREFRDKFKGLSDAEIREQIAGDTTTFTLPQIVHASALSSYVPVSDLEDARVVAGYGFADRTYRDEDSVVWVAAELDSKLEADPELVREWFVRLDEAIAAPDFTNVRFWLVAPEGFSPGALEIINERGGIGSSRRQLTFLREAIAGVRNESEAETYEMTIPMGEETELIAAHSLEEIARRHDFTAKAINQIKTALVEACINAAEHGLSPDQKIFLKFLFSPDRLVLTVSNRGIRLSDKLPAAAPTDEPSADTRRGWGLGLMRSLMDDVRVESVDDGTCIVMMKLRAA